MSENQSNLQPQVKKRPFYTMKRFIIPTVLVILFVIGSSAGSNNNSTKIGENSTNTSTSTPTPTTKSENLLADSYKVGDVVKVGDYIFSVLSFNENVQSTNQFITPKAGNKFVQIELSIENQSKDKTTVSTILQMYMKDKEGAKYTQTFLPDQKSLDGELLAGDKIKGQLSYEVPTTASGFKFYYSAAWLTGKSIVVNLN